MHPKAVAQLTKATLSTILSVQSSMSQSMRITLTERTRNDAGCYVAPDGTFISYVRSDYHASTFETQQEQSEMPYLTDEQSQAGRTEEPVEMVDREDASRKRNRSKKGGPFRQGSKSENLEEASDDPKGHRGSV